MELIQLPLIRTLDPKIPLIPRSKLVNIRPHKNSCVHKKEMEKLVREMLQNGVIQHNYNL